MDGPGVNGLERYWLGFFNEDLHDDDGSLLARPMGHHLLPHPMSLPEIEEWALGNLRIFKEALATCEANSGRSQPTSEA